MAKMFTISADYVTPKRKLVKSTHVHISSKNGESAKREALKLFKEWKLNVVRGSAKIHKGMSY